MLGFTGRLVAEYFAEHVTGVTWALAGRNLAKVEAEKAALVQKWPKTALGVLHCDNDDQGSVDACVAQAKAHTEPCTQPTEPLPKPRCSSRPPGLTSSVVLLW